MGRDPNCPHYNNCLTEAAQFNLNLNCNNCMREERPMRPDARKRESVAQQKLKARKAAVAAEIVAMIQEKYGL